MEKFVKIGIVPIKRGGTDMVSALEQKNLFLNKIKEILPETVDACDLEGVLPEGILYDASQLDAVAEHLREQKADAIFMPHCDFGCEEVVGRLGAMMKLPVLIWGNRDPLPVPGTRDRDTQCGTLASTKCLQRYRVPFSYIINSDVNCEMFKKGFVDFCAVAAVVKKGRGMRILQVGSRPQPFLSVICNEDELLRNFGIEITPYSSAILTRDVQRILEKRADEVEAGVKAYAEKVDVSLMPIETQRTQQAIKLAILDKVASSKSDGVAVECWSMLGPVCGVAGCQVLGMLSDLGVPCACETDVLGAISAVLLQAATLGREPIFFADITVRNANDDNTELLWHCGPFPVSLAHPNAKPSIAPMGQGQFELHNGDVTICRFDALEGNYTLMSGQGKAVDGPAKGGTYVWVKVSDWEKWEEKIVFGPYIHHVAGAFGSYSQILSEACKYLGPVQPDPMDPVSRVLGK